MKEVKAFAVPMKDPRCPEHCYSYCLNPIQHPHLDAYIHHLVALLTALCNTCGGVIFLSAPEGICHRDINFDQFKEYLHEVWCFPQSLCKLYKYTHRDQCDTSFWGIIVAKTSHQELPYRIGGNALTGKIDVHRRLNLTVKRPEEQQNMVNEEARKLPDFPESHPSTLEMDEYNHSSDAEDDAHYKSPRWVDVSELTWDRNKNNWDRILKREAKSFDDDVALCDILKPNNPMTVTPDEKSLMYLFQSSTEYDEIRMKVETKVPGFAIASRSWLSFLPQVDVKSLPISHLCDILTVTEDNDVCLWVVVSDSGEQVIQAQLEYMLTVGRTIKHQLLKKRKKGPNLTIRCHLCSTQVAANEFIENHGKYVLVQSMQVILHLKFQETNSGGLRQGIALLLLSKETSVTSCIGDKMSLRLSANQAKTLFVLNGHKVSYVDAPPGAGKTLFGVSLYKQYEKEGSVYVCPTKPLLQYLRYNACEGTLIRTDEDLCRQIDLGTFENKKCVVIDESHHLEWQKESWGKLFTMLKKNRKMLLFVFADNKFQCFETRNPNEVFLWIADLSVKILNVAPYRPDVSEMYRNTKQIVSFVQHAALTTATTDINIKYGNDLDGDGIQCKVMENLWTNAPENSLVQYLLPICVHTSSSMDAKYHVTNVAVLLDAGYTDDEIGLIHQILQAHLPRITTHASDKFPREGIVVDRIERFIGLDVGLCIFLLSPMGEQRIIENTYYRIFLASRATHKAVFVVSKIDAAFAKCMKFDLFPESMVSLS